VAHQNQWGLGLGLGWRSWLAGIKHTTHQRAMKHGYGNLGAVPVLGTAEVRVQPGYCCMRAPGIPNLFKKKKKKNSRYGSGTGGVESSKKLCRFLAKIKTHGKIIRLSVSPSLYHPPFAATLTRFSLSHILSLPATMHSELRFGLAASFFLSSFLFFSLGIFLSLRWA
jgi:hypothetical protein